MNSISLITANTSIITGPANTAVLPSARLSAESAPAVSTLPSPASVVILGQDAKTTEPGTYRSLGATTITQPVYTREQEVSDPVTRAVMGNIYASTTAGRFQGLGAALLQQLAESGSSRISQSVLRSSAEEVKNPAAVALAQARLHEDADNTISMTLKTRNGATITLNLSSSRDGVAVQADVTGGTLSDSERKALGTLAEGFQQAVDGLTALKPRLNLSALSQLDPKMFASVDLSARLKLAEDQYQTLSFKADDKTKSVDMRGVQGNLQLSVKNNNAILGNAQQQAKAVERYLEQFDAAQNRGEGDKDLMTLFKDAFSTLQTPTRSTISAATRPTNEPVLTEVDHALLTGLADFDASLIKTTRFPNPMRPLETDRFAYKASQSTEIKGTTAADRSIEQKQTTSLSAAYHKSLYPGVELALSMDPESQNYKYYQLDDEASSKTRIAYVDGGLVEASSTQSARQSTSVQTFERGKLIDTVTTPKEVSQSRNLLAMIDSALRDDSNSRVLTGVSTLEQGLKPIHEKVLLQSNPSSITR